MSNYGYVLAELLKRNTELHGNELLKRGNRVSWVNEARKVIIVELRSYPVNYKLKAFSGFVWGRLRRQDITTRHIYILLLQWAVLLTEKGLLYFYTKEYEELIEELRITIESGAEGSVEDVSSGEIIDEWNFVEGYLVSLQNMCEEYENKK